MSKIMALRVRFTFWYIGVFETKNVKWPVLRIFEERNGNTRR